MPKSLRCADAGMDCAGQFTTETEDELMKHVQLHAAEAHPDLEITPELAEQILAWAVSVGTTGRAGRRRIRGRGSPGRRR